MLGGRRAAPRGLVSRWVVTACACLSHSTSHPSNPGPALHRTFPHTSDPSCLPRPRCALAFASAASPPLATPSCREIAPSGKEVPLPRYLRPHRLPRRCEQGRLFTSRLDLYQTAAGGGDGGGFQWNEELRREVGRLSEGTCEGSRLLLGEVHAPIERVLDPELDAFGVELFLKREDMIDPEISGNKWRKVKYNGLQALATPGCRGMATFGGAFSNHIAATAAVGARLGIATVGIIRGDELATRPLNPTLQRAADQGMRLEFLSRTAYREATHSREQQEALVAGLGEGLLLVPEGGANALGLYGCAETLGSLPYSALSDFDVFASACGTGATIAGIAASVAAHPERAGQRRAHPTDGGGGGIRPDGRGAPVAAGQGGGGGRARVLGFPALKGGDFLKDDAAALLGMCAPPESVEAAMRILSLQTDYHFGGYGKTTPELIAFMRRFYERSNVKLDPVYTGKMLFGIYDMAKKGELCGCRVLAIHTGGLQGILAMERRLGEKIF